MMKTDKARRNAVAAPAPWTLLALVLFLAGMTGTVGCGKSTKQQAPPKDTTDLSGQAVYGWTICPKWGALVYSNGQDIIWQDRQTGRRVNLTAPLQTADLPPDIKKAVLAHEAKLSVGQRRQKGSELYPSCSPDGSLIAFSAVRTNDNDDHGDDADSDIWAIRITAQLADDLRSGRSMSRDKNTPIYFGPLEFVQLTNLPKIQEAMPSFSPKGDRLLFLGRNNHLWSLPLSVR